MIPHIRSVQKGKWLRQKVGEWCLALGGGSEDQLQMGPGGLLGLRAVLKLDDGDSCATRRIFLKILSCIPKMDELYDM